MSENGLMTIGELSRRSGMSVKVIRSWTDLGLVFCEGRSAGNYRLYDERALWCLSTIAGLRSLGLPLGDIQQLRALYGDGARETVGPWLLERLAGVRADLDRRIEQLKTIRDRVDAFTAAHADNLQRGALDEVICIPLKKYKASTEGGLSMLTSKQKEASVAGLVERLEAKPWEFGESGENIKEVVKEATGITIEHTQKAVLEEVFWSAVERLRYLDDLSSVERRLFDFYNRAFQNGEKPPVAQAERVLGMSFTTENRIRVVKKFLWRAVAMPILTDTEKRVWDFTVKKTQVSGQPPEASDIETSIEMSPTDVRETLDVLRKMGFLKGDVGEDAIAFNRSMAGAIASQATSAITVTLKDGRKMVVNCAIDALVAGFKVGQQDFVAEAKDPHSGEKVKVEIREGQLSSYKPKGVFVFNGGTCPNINFFSSEANLRSWQDAHPEAEGEVMTLDEAFGYGKKMIPGGQHAH